MDLFKGRKGKKQEEKVRKSKLYATRLVRKGKVKENKRFNHTPFLPPYLSYIPTLMYIPIKKM